jgi:hypothetical protein
MARGVNHETPGCWLSRRRWQWPPTVGRTNGEPGGCLADQGQADDGAAIGEGRHHDRVERICKRPAS